MNWITGVVLFMVFWSSTVWGATLSWNPNSESDLAGYRIYKCDRLPCGRASGTASNLATLGKVTTFNIGSPAVIQHYVVIAYDTMNNESSDSNVATFTPSGAPPPPPLPPAPTGLRVLPPS